jgi:DNA-binding Lrp family transcriptional regulator
MSNKELDRASVMARLQEGSLSQRAAAEALGITERQVRCLLRGYEAYGAAALISKRRGKLLSARDSRPPASHPSSRTTSPARAPLLREVRAAEDLTSTVRRQPLDDAFSDPTRGRRVAIR